MNPKNYFTDLNYTPLEYTNSTPVSDFWPLTNFIDHQYTYINKVLKYRPKKTILFSGDGIQHQVFCPRFDTFTFCFESNSEKSDFFTEVCDKFPELASPLMFEFSKCEKKILLIKFLVHI